MATEKLSPGMQQYVDIKKQYPDAFLLFRMGDFYELFYEDAVNAAQILEISLTSRCLLYTSLFSFLKLLFLTIVSQTWAIA